MYKALLCWRYLRTRYLALACVVSVMLGVATLIVVNSVMGGFSTKLKERLHGISSDVIVESQNPLDGFPDAEAKMERIRNDPFLRDKIKALTPTLEVFAMIQFQIAGETITRPVRLIGIDPQGRAQIGGFAEHLLNEDNRRHPSFELSKEAREYYEWHHRPRPMLKQRFEQNQQRPPRLALNSWPDQPIEERPAPEPWVRDDIPQFHIPKGIIVGNAIASFRDKSADGDEKARDVYLLQPGDFVTITTVSRAIPTPNGPKVTPVTSGFVVCDFFRSEMSEYDAQYVFVPLAYLQRLRTMEDRVTSIQIKLKDYRDAPQVVRALREMFAETPGIQVFTWEDKQGALLAAISIEKGLLNVLLFLIIAVAGFGILAIFSMIVTEKTRDIGILKALGASNGGVMNIFLGYGLLLGLVGAGLGTGLGLTLTYYINEIEQFLGRLTGQQIFNRGVYYFDKIPTDIQMGSVILVNLGSLAIAVFFSVLPALRAAWLHPVRALRYE